MQFCQLIEHNMRNIILENSCTKCGGETMPRLLKTLKNRNWAYLWINNLNFYKVYFRCMSSWGRSIRRWRWSSHHCNMFVSLLFHGQSGCRVPLYQHTIRGDCKCVLILCLAMMPKSIILTRLILNNF